MAFGMTLSAIRMELDKGWRADALCRQVDPELFFPARGESSAEAKRVCRACEVREDCLRAALRNEETHGIWGGYRMTGGLLKRFRDSGLV